MICPSCKADSEGCAYCPNCGTPLTQQGYQNAPPNQRTYTSPDQTYYSNQYKYQQNQQAPPNANNTYNTPPQNQCEAPAYNQPQTVNYYYAGMPVSRKSRLATLLLAIFLGVIGVHRFYVGKVGTGILWLFTGGFFGIGYIVDIILIACGSFRDSYGFPIVRW